MDDERRAHLDHGTRRILESIARGHDAATVLDAVCAFMDAHLSQVRTSVLLLDDATSTLTHAVAPGLPEAYVRAIDGEPIGPRAGSCGTAAFRGEAVVSEDIASDPLWSDYAEVALRHGLRACWSLPLLRTDGSVAGTMALYYDRPGRPSDDDVAFAQVAAHLAELAIDRAEAADALARSESDYRSLFDAIDDGLAVLRLDTDADGRPTDAVFERANPVYEQLTGRRGLAGTTLREVAGANVEDWLDAFARVVRSGESTRIERAEQEHDRHVQVYAYPLGRANEHRIAVLVEDTTDAVRAQDALRDSERRFRAMAEFRRSVMIVMERGLEQATPDSFEQLLLEEAVRVIPGAETGSILKREQDGRFRFVATVGFDLEALRSVRMPAEAIAFGRAEGTRSPQVIKDPQIHPTIPGPDAETLETEGRVDALRAVLTVPIVTAGEMTACLTLDNYESADAYSDEAVDMATIFARQVASLTQRFELERTLYRQAYRDELTSLPNRSAFKERLSELLPTSEADHAPGSDARVAVLFVDLDNLKPINDSLGHGAGDSVLVEVARRIEACVPPGGFVARLGGDEFTVVLAGDTVRDDAAGTAERIVAALQDAIRVQAYEVRVGASIGVSLCPADGTTTSDLLRHADIAMYHAKQGGKGTFRFFADEMEAGARQRIMLEGALRDGLERDEFEVHYQPRISLRDGRIVAVEALVRWRHPSWGLVAPGSFVPLAEATNLIHALGRRVLELACAEAASWDGNGDGDGDGDGAVRVAVNVSRHQLQRKDILDEIANTLRATGLAPDRLEIEVTESSAMHDIAETVRTLAQLRELGVRVSLDDFGTGHSSLGWLQQLPVDVLKLDRAFLTRIEDGEQDDRTDDRAILRAVVDLGRALGLDVVAEGVERASQLAMLRRLGCDEAQGFLFCRPVPAPELRILLTQGRMALPESD